MTLVGSLLRASIGKKFLMALTGAVLIAFVTGHLIGNLQIFGAPEKINGYAHFLQSLGPMLWAVRLVLLACVFIHIAMAVQLTLEDYRARPEPYEFRHTIQATLSSRTMRWTGVVVLAFLLYHLAQFTVGWVHADEFKSGHAYAMAADFHLLGFPVVARGQEVPDVYSMVFLGFSHPAVSVFYVLAVGLLSFHLAHGADSMFQTLGWRSEKWAGWLKKIVVLYCVLYFLGNLAIPGAILTGMAKPAAGTYAARILAAAHGSAVVQR
ncbi:MAG TPA: succinate dehydrogenase cytochrome b subunit [Opitutaceae bacterium]|nr:succinate dehydrogenase cytochrome b subunit [Opitutaceae bacterium]